VPESYLSINEKEHGPLLGPNLMPSGPMVLGFFLQLSGVLQSGVDAIIKFI
jgi:hypothetical protein